MSAAVFDDARLDAPETVEDPRLLALAGSGARIRRDAAQAAPDLEEARPRGVIAMGDEARLIRAVLEQVCPVPFVAWPGPGLPGWVGPLDLVVFLGASRIEPSAVLAASEAARRGASLLVAAPKRSELAEAAASRDTVVLNTTTGDSLAAAVAVLACLHKMGLGPLVIPEHVAEAADVVAEACAPGLDLAANPAKDLALRLADRVPLVWGGTVLAARASRRVAQALRLASGRIALAADSDALGPLLSRVSAPDLFADPDESLGQPVRPALVVLEDVPEPPLVRTERLSLTAAADAAGASVALVRAGDEELPTTSVDRYVTLLMRGLYGAAYLAIGLDRNG